MTSLLADYVTESANPLMMLRADLQQSRRTFRQLSREGSVSPSENGRLDQLQNQPVCPSRLHLSAPVRGHLK